MHSAYASTVEDLKAWAARTPGVKALVVMGSQARAECPGDAWSDLDLLALAEEPESLIADDLWLEAFGRPILIAQEIVPIESLGFAWFVKRPLYDDFRALDISIMPAGSLDAVLAVNREILARGFEVVYDATGRSLAELIRGSASDVPRPRYAIPSEAELSALVVDLLYHVIWSYRKIRRGELWTAVRCVNEYMRNGILRLVEARNAASGSADPVLLYDGRLLESRTSPAVLERLRGCFAKYDEADALEALDDLPGLVGALGREAASLLGYRFDEGRVAAAEEALGRLRRL
jgi:aminoglycoside 6-adenylyltransferase